MKNKELIAALRKLGACSRGIKAVGRKNLKSAWASSLSADLYWLVSDLSLWTPDLRAAYDKAVAEARAAYDEATAEAQSAYNKATAEPRAARDKATAEARAAYAKAVAEPRAARDKATAEAWAAYAKATAEAIRALFPLSAVEAALLKVLEET